MTTILNTDFYKTEHHLMMPEGTSSIYNNLTPRKSRIPGIDKVVVFGAQGVWMDLVHDFQVNFFDKDWNEVDVEYREFVNVDTAHIKALHTLGYLPLVVKSLPEGTLCPIGVPVWTVKETISEFAWLVNYLESVLSVEIWHPITSATIAHEYKKLLTKWAVKTGGDLGFVQWQGHDFSFRGHTSRQSATKSGAAHLTSFYGTDTVPALPYLKKYYAATGLIGGSIPASEHSVQCMHYDYETGAEDSYIQQILKQYPKGPVSMVSDGFDFWRMVTEVLPKYRDDIMKRDGKLVIRPDSGDPVDIVCGREDLHKDTLGWYDKHGKAIDEAERKGLIEVLWNIFGGTTVTGADGKTYRVLDSHIGAIYGDSITLDRAGEICRRLAAKGFASTNIVFGVGSFTYQYVTRDTFGFAIKATYGEVKGIGRELFKAPKTDDGTKKSAKGLLMVANATKDDGSRTFVLIDQANKEMESKGALKVIFENGRFTNLVTLQEIRTRLQNEVNSYLASENKKLEMA